MNVHEYQGKGSAAQVRRRRAAQASWSKRGRRGEKAAEDLGTPVVVVKSQIHAGGRGAGAIVENEDEAAEVFEKNLEARRPTEARQAGRR